MLLSYWQLKDLVDNGVVTNVKPEQINSASIDLTLGDTIFKETRPAAVGDEGVSLRMRERLYGEDLKIRDGYHLWPEEFILACTEQRFYLPNNISAEYKLKSSMARIGLEHLNAGWCDAGWTGSVLTLELKNVTRFHTIVLQPGDPIGQIVFFQHEPVPDHKSYAKRGRYNGDTTVTGAKK
jgi:dCTP deaminase